MRRKNKFGAKESPSKPGRVKQEPYKTSERPSYGDAIVARYDFDGKPRDYVGIFSSKVSDRNWKIYFDDGSYEQLSITDSKDWKYKTNLSA
jgi:hypothetical protein